MKHSAALKIASLTPEPAPLSEPPNTSGLDEAWFGEEVAAPTHRSYVRRSGVAPKPTEAVVSWLPGGDSAKNDAPVRRLLPKADVFESPSVTLILIDAPGVSSNDISLEIVEGALRYHATRSATEPAPTTCYERSFPLERRVDLDEIDATLHHGVLRVRLPVLSKPPCRVPVQSIDVSDDVVDLEPSDVVEI